MIKKINTNEAISGKKGEKFLASGDKLGMRYWNEPAGEQKPISIRPYETVGYVIEGHAEFEMNGVKTNLGPGDSYLVPANSKHTYKILDHFVAVEATTPPARGSEMDSY